MTIINIYLLPKLGKAALGLLQPLFVHVLLVIEVGVWIVGVVLRNLVGLAMAGVGFGFSGFVWKEKIRLGNVRMLRFHLPLTNIYFKVNLHV